MSWRGCKHTFGNEENTGEPYRFQICHVAVVAKGLMFAGICFEIRGKEVRVTECKIFWFAMFSHFDRVIDLLEGAP
jgi:hypothetical protein